MKLAVIGTGNMGSWLVKEFVKDHEVAVFDINKQKTNNLNGALVLNSLAELTSFEPEYVINGVNISKTVPVFEEIGPHLTNKATIVDITSIKGDLPRYYDKIDNKFASIHPMFGPRFANLKSISGENAIIISESEHEAKKFFSEFFKKLQVNVYEYSFSDHDELMSYSLTLPFTSSIVFSACVSGHTVPGTTFARHKKIAEKLLQEDDFLLSETLFNPQSIKQLEKITSQLEFLKHVIKAKDYEEASKFYKKLRNNLI